MKYLKLYEEYNNTLSDRVFFHQSDNPDLKFKKEYNGYYHGYIFFSYDKQYFIEREWTYEVYLNIEKSDIFNINKYVGKKEGLEDSFSKHSDRIINFLKSNLDYLYDVWKNKGEEDPESIQYYWNEKKGLSDDNITDKLELLLWFLREWVYSWCILEDKKFLDFIEILGYKGFATQEEDIVNIAIKDVSLITIKSKYTFTKNYS